MHTAALAFRILDISTYCPEEARESTQTTMPFAKRKAKVVVPANEKESYQDDETLHEELEGSEVNQGQTSSGDTIWHG